MIRPIYCPLTGCDCLAVSMDLAINLSECYLCERHARLSVKLRTKMINLFFHSHLLLMEKTYTNIQSFIKNVM